MPGSSTTSSSRSPASSTTPCPAATPRSSGWRRSGPRSHPTARSPPATPRRSPTAPARSGSATPRAWRGSARRAAVKLVDWEIAAIDFRLDEGMLMAPGRAIPRLLARHGLTFGDIALYEIHEAFAAQVLANVKAASDPAYRRERAQVDADLGGLPLGPRQPAWRHAGARPPLRRHRRPHPQPGGKGVGGDARRVPRASSPSAPTAARVRWRCWSGSDVLSAIKIARANLFGALLPPGGEGRPQRGSDEGSLRPLRLAHRDSDAAEENHEKHEKHEQYLTIALPRSGPARSCFSCFSRSNLTRSTRPRRVKGSPDARLEHLA